MNKKVIILLILFISFFLRLSADEVLSSSSFADYSSLPTLVQFGTGYNPGVFIREKAGKAETVSIKQSLFWDTAGTRILSVKAGKTKDSLLINILSNTAITRNVSYFLYIFPKRISGKKNTLTLEIPVSSKEKNVYLWNSEAGLTPEIVGSFQYNDFSLSVNISLEKIYKKLTESEIQTMYFELSSCYFGIEQYEEYFFTTVYFSDFPDLSAKDPS